MGAFQYPVAEANTARTRHALPRCRVASAKLTRAVSRGGSARPDSPSKLRPSTATSSRAWSPRKGSSKGATTTAVSSTFPPRSVRVDRVSSPLNHAAHAGGREEEEGEKGNQNQQQQQGYREVSSSSSAFLSPRGG